MQTRRFKQLVLLSLSLALLLPSSAWALKPQEMAENSGLEELSHELEKPASTAGLEEDNYNRALETLTELWDTLSRSKNKLSRNFVATAVNNLKEKRASLLADWDHISDGTDQDSSRVQELRARFQTRATEVIEWAEQQQQKTISRLIEDTDSKKKQSGLEELEIVQDRVQERWAMMMGAAGQDPGRTVFGPNLSKLGPIRILIGLEERLLSDGGQRDTLRAVTDLVSNGVYSANYLGGLEEFRHFRVYADSALIEVTHTGLEEITLSKVVRETLLAFGVPEGIIAAGLEQLVKDLERLATQL